VADLTDGRATCHAPVNRTEAASAAKEVSRAMTIEALLVKLPMNRRICL